MKNVLLLNVGTRNKLVSYFMKEMSGNGKVIVTDNYFLAPALFEANKYYITSREMDAKYWDEIEKICEAEDIGLIVSLFDPELELLAKEKERFTKKGIIVNTSTESVIRRCYSKLNTIDFLKKKGYSVIQTYKSVQEALIAIETGKLAYPVFLKPDLGSGSSGIRIVDNEVELQESFKEGYVIQEYMDGQEIGVDVFVDCITGEVCSVFLKKKLKMRAGETDKSVSFTDENLFNIITKFSKEFGLSGANDIDVFEKKGEYYISEVNPRFGGGYLHAYECGVNFPRMLINNMNGISNPVDIGKYKANVYMMKYFDIKMLEK